MAALGSQSIASSYEQLLHVDADGGGNSTTHVSVKDGDNGTTFGFTIASDALMMSSTNRLEFGDTGTYIHQSADGVLDLVSDTEIEINATTIDINGAVQISGNTGIGDDASTPLGRLHVATGDSGASAWASADELVVEGSANAGVNILTGSNNTGYIAFGDSGDAGEATIGFFHGSGGEKFNFSANGNSIMNMEESGEITAPLQPAFLATPASAQSDIAADDSSVTVVFGTEVFDQGADFASNTFTAPVTGRYQFSVNIRVDNIDTAAEYYILTLKASNRDVRLDMFDPDLADQDIPYYFMRGSVLVDMDASDTCYVTITQNGGSAQSDIQSGTNTSFSGYLAC